jgi:HK97 family phage major capsid protein
MDKAEEMAKGINDKIDGLKSQIEGSVTKDELKSANEALESFQKENKETLEGYQKTINELKDSLKEQGEVMTKLKETGITKVGKTLTEEIKSNKEELKSIAKGLSSKEVIVKADTLRAAIVGNQQAVELNDIGQLAHAKLTAYDIFRKIPVSESNNNGVIRYYDWNASTTVRAAAMVAEGAAFPESTAKWETVTITLKKIGDTLPVSEEFFEDEAMFAAELDMFLDTNVRIKRNDQIINGDGTGQNLKGIVASTNAFSASASGISDASIYDLFVKVSEDITKTGGSKYSPDFGLMNITDINAMKLKKDANENYIIPPFVSRDGKEVSGMMVLEDNDIVANTMVIGDSRYARIYEKAGIVLSRGRIDAQFTEDMETLKARTRLLFLIRNVDKTGFLKVTSISAALVTLAS